MVGPEGRVKIVLLGKREDGKECDTGENVWFWEKVVAVEEFMGKKEKRKTLVKYYGKPKTSENVPYRFTLFFQEHRGFAVLEASFTEISGQLFDKFFGRWVGIWEYG